MPKPSPEFPALREFLRGYFHQDLADEYGSPQAAAKQFWQDADDEQRMAVANEWARLLDHAKDLSLDYANELLRNLGSAWTFTNPAELQKITEVFRTHPKSELNRRRRDS